MITLSANKGRSDVRGSSRKTRLRIATLAQSLKAKKVKPGELTQDIGACDNSGFFEI